MVENTNQHMGILYRNEKAFADMVYTNSVRISVLRRIAKDKFGVDDVAFDALVDQELAKRKEEEAQARREVEEKAKTQTATEKAKELGMKVAKEYEHTVEDVEFGGDFGEDAVGAKAADQDQPGEDSDGAGSGVDHGPLDAT